MLKNDIFLIFLWHMHFIFFWKYRVWVPVTVPLDKWLFSRPQEWDEQTSKLGPWISENLAMGTEPKQSCSSRQGTRALSPANVASLFHSRPCSACSKTHFAKWKQTLKNMNPHYCHAPGAHPCPVGCWHRTLAAQSTWQSLNGCYCLSQALVFLSSIYFPFLRQLELGESLS